MVTFSKAKGKKYMLRTCGIVMFSYEMDVLSWLD